MREKVSMWKLVFDQCYQKAFEASDKKQNFFGWQSSYTGKPIPLIEMKAWLDEVVERIASLQPRNIYEIGAGTGLVMFSLLEICKSYCATDLSEKAVEYLRQYTPSNFHHVKFIQEPADDFSEFINQSYDTFVMNSVVQYFPHSSYLEKVLSGIIGNVADGGTIFIGDIRNAKYLRAFHASVEIFKSQDSADVLSLKKDLEKRVANDIELSMDPAFFTDLKSKYSRITHVEVMLKKGVIQNELTKFRYDVFLHIGRRDRRYIRKCLWTEDLNELKLLLQSKPKSFQLIDVPNYSVIGLFKVLEIIKKRNCGSMMHLKKLVNEKKISDKWKQLYALISDEYNINPIYDFENDERCSLKCIKN